MDREKYLEERESIGEILINVREWAMDRADERFKREYEDTHKYSDLYDVSVRHPESGEPLSYVLNEKYNDVYFGMVDDFEEELLEYKSEEYDT